MANAVGGLGEAFDIAPVVAVQDLCGISTQVMGEAISLENAEGVTFVLFAGDGNGTTDDLTWDLQEIDGAGGTPQDLDIITEYYTKLHASDLGADIAWTKVTQSAASEVAAIAGTQEQLALIAFSVRADQLSDGYTHVTIRQPDLGSTDAKYGGWVALLWGLKVKRAPENLAAPQ